MNESKISIILPFVSDQSRLSDFLIGVFSSGAVSDISICSEFDSDCISSLDSGILSKVKVFPSSQNSLGKAIDDAQGGYILFSDVAITYASDAFATMLLNGACAVNGSSTDGNLFSANFQLNEVASRAAFYCCLIKSDILKSNGIEPVCNSALSVMNLIADYSRYDTITPVHESLFHVSKQPEKIVGERDIENLENYSWIFSQTANDCSTLFFISSLMAFFSDCRQKQSFELLRNILVPFMSDYAICAWFKATFGWDPEMLKSDVSFNDFKRTGTQVMYREVKSPIKEKEIVDGFFYGKLSAAVLKRSIWAYLYNKSKRFKNSFLRNKLCVLCKRKLGGGYNV